MPPWFPDDCPYLHLGIRRPAPPRADAARATAASMVGVRVLVGSLSFPSGIPMGVSSLLGCLDLSWSSLALSLILMDAVRRWAVSSCVAKHVIRAPSSCFVTSIRAVTTSPMPFICVAGSIIPSFIQPSVVPLRATPDVLQLTSTTVSFVSKISLRAPGSVLSV